MKRPSIRMPSLGFSLVEMLIAAAIGLVTVIVAMQVLINASERKRVSISGVDSAVNATLGLYTIERDVKNAGFGLTTVQASTGCKVKGRFKVDSKTKEDVEFNLVPAVITNGDGGAPDTLRIRYSAKNIPPLPILITKHPITAANFKVASVQGVEEGDMMVAVPAAARSGTVDCTLFEVTKVATNHLNHSSGKSKWNHPGGHHPFPPDGYEPGDYLVNLGSFVDHTYSISDDNFLQRQVYRMAINSDDEEEIYPHIVQLQAAYGVDTDLDGQIDDWIETAPSDWQDVLAVRVALVARGTAREATQVTPPDNTCENATTEAPAPVTAVCWHPDPSGDPVDIALNIGGANPDWRHYRYRVVETTIPLRNAIWSQ